MFQESVQYGSIDPFNKVGTLLKDTHGSSFDKSFDETLEEKIKEIAQKAKDKSNELATESKEKSSKKVKKEQNINKLPDITKMLQELDKKDLRSSKSTNPLFDNNKQKADNDLSQNLRQQMYNPNHAGQAMVQPVYDQGPKRQASKSQMLAAWERFAPSVTEDPMKKSVRLDIPLVNDIQAIVLRMHPDRSVSASMLGSYQMAELIKQNKDQLDRNLRHHQLSLKEFNTYRSELELNGETGTRKNNKKKKKNDNQKKTGIDLL